MSNDKTFLHVLVALCPAYYACQNKQAARARLELGLGLAEARARLDLA